MARKLALGFDVAVSNQTTERLKEVETRLLAVSEGLKNARKEGDKEVFGKLKVEQKALREELKATNKEIRDQIKDFNSSQFDPTSLIGLRQRYRELRREVDQLDAAGRESDFGQQLISEAARVKQSIKDIAGSVGDFRDNVGDYQGAVERALSSTQALLSGSLSSLAAGLGIGGALAGGLDLLDSGIDSVRQISEEFIRLRGVIQQLTGAAGAELDQFSIQIKALASTYEEDTDRIVQAANAVSKQLGIDFGSALDLVNRGFQAGANNSGQFLDSLSEYAPFIREANIEAETFVRIIAQSSIEGVFNDKGIDAIKEATLSLRELTPATVAALEGIGITADQITAVIDEDGIGGAIELVSQKLEGFADDSREVGAVLADVFRGAGEDAGVQFIRSFGNIEGGLDELIDAGNEYVRAQQRQLDANLALAEAQNNLFKEFSDATVDLQVLGTRALTAIVQGLLNFLNIIQAIPRFIKENRVELGFLAVAMLALNANAVLAAGGLLKARAATIAQSVVTQAAVIQQRLLNVAMRANPIGLVISAVAILIGGFVALTRRSDTVRASIAGLGNLAAEVFKIIKEGVAAFTEGFSQLSEGNVRAGLRSIGTGLSKFNPVTTAIFEGKRLKDAFVDGYQERKAELAVENESEALNKSLQELENKNAGTAEAAGRGIGEALDKGLGESIASLKERKEELEKELETAAIGTTRFKDIQTELDEVNRRLSQATANEAQRSKAAVEAANKAVDASLAGMRSKVAKLKQEIERSDSPDNVIKDKLEEVVALEQQIESTEEKINGLRAEIEREPITNLAALQPTSIAPLQTNLTANLGGDVASEENRTRSTLEQIERRKQAAINAVLSEGLAREVMEQRLKEIERANEIEILDFKLQNEELTNAQRLTLANELAQKELEIEDEKIAEKRRKNEELNNFLKASFSQLAGSFLQIDRNRLQNRLDQEKTALEEEFEAKIAAAEGDTARQEELKQELEEKKVQADRKAARERKKIARKEAIIQGALSLIEAVPNPFQMGLAILTTATQLAVIASQQFAKGGQVQPNGRGKAKVKLSQPGVKISRQQPGMVSPSSRNIPRQSNGDDVLATVGVGEVLLNKEQQRRIRLFAGRDVFRRAGVPGFNTGGIVGGDNIPQIVNPNEVGTVATTLSVDIPQETLLSQAEMIAEKTAEKTAKAVLEGMIEGNRENIRYNRLNSNLEQ